MTRKERQLRNADREVIRQALFVLRCQGGHRFRQEQGAGFSRRHVPEAHDRPNEEVGRKERGRNRHLCENLNGSSPATV